MASTTATLQLGVSAAPAGANASVTWVSATPAVATVSASGLVTGKTAGTSVITATSTVDPTVKGTVTVTVPPAVPATPTITFGSTPGTALVGTPYPVTASSSDSSSTVTITVKSAGSTGATFSGGNLNTTGPGQVTLAANGTKGEAEVTKTITVNRPNLTGIKLSKVTGDITGGTVGGTDAAPTAEITANGTPMTVKVLPVPDGAAIGWLTGATVTSNGTHITGSFNGSSNVLTLNADAAVSTAENVTLANATAGVSLVIKVTAK